MARYTRDDVGLVSPRASTGFSGSEGVFVHYTWGSHSDKADRSKEIVRQVQRDHLDKGWNDIGYSFLVDDAGNIFEGRGWGVEGAHTKGYNDKAHAVAYLGRDGTPTPAALRSINSLIYEHDATYGTGYVKRHKDVANTSCPGAFLSQWVENGRPVSDDANAVRGLPHGPGLSTQQPIAAFDLLGELIAALDGAASIPEIRDDYEHCVPNFIGEVAESTVRVHLGRLRRSGAGWDAHNRARRLAATLRALHERFELVALERAGFPPERDIDPASTEFARAHQAARRAEAILLACMSSRLQKYAVLSEGIFDEFRPVDVLYSPNFELSSVQEAAGLVSRWFARRPPSDAARRALAMFCLEKGWHPGHAYQARLQSMHLLHSVFEHADKDLMSRLSVHGDEFPEFKNHFYALILGVLAKVEVLYSENATVRDLPIANTGGFLMSMLREITSSIRVPPVWVVSEERGYTIQVATKKLTVKTEDTGRVTVDLRRLRELLISS